VIPREVLDAPTPEEDETLRARSSARGAASSATSRSAAIDPAATTGTATITRSAPSDRTTCLAVEGDDLYVDAEAELDGDPAPPVLLCPFDNLLWDRPLLERLFGFHHVIEVYKREPERAYGYYVLPLLAGDRIVGRADLKADRAEGILHVRRFHPEPRVRGNVMAKLERAAARLARVLGLAEVRHA
jgi:uncharacterized protein YcaQ